jgi:hypothetical protein
VGVEVEREGATANQQTILGSGFQDGEMRKLCLKVKVVALTKAFVGEGEWCQRADTQLAAKPKRVAMRQGFEGSPYF